MTYQYTYLAVDVSERIATVTVNRPEVRNAMNPAAWRELLDCVQKMGEDDDVRAIIITGAGEKAFVSGADISSLKTRTAIDTLDMGPQLATAAIEQSPKPVIAAVNGAAFGGGFELALACDLRLTCDRTRFGLPEPGLGIVPGIGGTQRLARCVGMSVAKQVILAGRTLTGEQAVELGLALECVSQDLLLQRARELAAKLLTRGPLALMLAKKLLYNALSTNQEAGTLMEKLSLCVLMDSADKDEGVSAFLEKRAPTFTGH